MKRTNVITFAALAMLGFSSLLLPSRATAQTETYGGVTCTAQTATTFPQEEGNYPADGHLWECVPNASDTDLVYDGIVGYQSSAGETGGTGGLGQMKSVGAVFYHFNDVSDANTFISGKYSGTALKALVPTTSNGRCGYTGYVPQQMVASYVVTSIYEFCYYTLPASQGARNVSNPSIYQTAAHEAGHSFDFSLALNSSKPFTPTTYTSPWASLAAGELTWMDTSGVLTCNLFSSIAPSVLELNQGADNTNPVCTNGVVNSAYSGKSNSAIAKLKAPYFFGGTNSSNGEIWAEEGAISTSGSQGALPFIDNLLTSLQSYGGGCTMRTVKWWNDFSTPPVYGGEYPNSCAVYSSSSWNH